MSNRAALIAVVTAFAVGLLGSLAVRPAPEQSLGKSAQGLPEVRWRLPVAFGTNLPALGDNILYVGERIEAISGGRFQVEIFEPGKLVPPFSIVDAVREKKVPAGYTWLGYDQGKLPVSVLFGAVPFGPEPWAYSAWWYEGGGQKLAEEIYAPLGIPPDSLWFDRTRKQRGGFGSPYVRPRISPDSKFASPAWAAKPCSGWARRSRSFPGAKFSRPWSAAPSTPPNFPCPWSMPNSVSIGWPPSTIFRDGTNPSRHSISS